MKKLLLILLLLFPVHGAWGAYTTPTDATCKDGKQEYSEAQKHMPVDNPKMAKDALTWLNKAIEKGCGDAAFDAGLIWQTKGDQEKWIAYMKVAAEFDHPDGLIMYGSMLTSEGKIKKGCEMMRKGMKLGGKNMFMSNDQVLKMAGCK